MIPLQRQNKALTIKDRIDTFYYIKKIKNLTKRYHKETGNKDTRQKILVTHIIKG